MSINRFSFALNSSENERYLVRKGVDMLAVLRALASRAQPTSLYFGEKDDVLETKLIGINPPFEEMIFSPGDDAGNLERLIAAGSFGVETLLDSIRILFIATNAEVTRFKGGIALRARIPETLARMQRRESVRIPVPADKPCYCTVRVSTEPLKELRLKVHDISIGGIALSVPASETALMPGRTLSECSLDLAGIGLMHCALDIVYRVEAQAGSTEMRIGCHFAGLAALSREQVRSHVSRLERATLAKR